MSQPEPETNRWDVFISYARGDSEPFVKQLYRDLRKRNVSIWWDRKAMESRGRSFLQEIRDGIAAVRRLILVIDPKASQSDYVRVEWEFALENCKIVIPILRSGERSQEAADRDYELVPPKLKRRNFHCIDFRASRFYEEAFGELFENIRTPLTALAEQHGVPPLPPHFIPRPTEMDRLEEIVLADLAQPTVITSAKQATALHGMVGIGKSVLAMAFAHACGTRFAFPDGVIWLTLGQKPDLVGSLRSAGNALGDHDPQRYIDLQTGQENLAKALAGKVCLLILDDVWDLAHAEVFKNAGSRELRSRILITSRDRQLATNLGAHEHPVDMLDDAAALQLLAEWAIRIRIDCLRQRAK